MREDSHVLSVIGPSPKLVQIDINELQTRIHLSIYLSILHLIIQGCQGFSFFVGPAQSWLSKPQTFLSYCNGSIRSSFLCCSPCRTISQMLSISFRVNSEFSSKVDKLAHGEEGKAKAILPPFATVVRLINGTCFDVCN